MAQAIAVPAPNLAFSRTLLQYIARVAPTRRGRRRLMMDFNTARRMMVDSQVRPNNVTDPDLVAAMLEVPREKFVPAGMAPLAYLDRDVPVSGDGRAPVRRYLLQPMVLAKLIQAAEVASSDHVLDVASGTGYSSAILARIAASVVALDDDQDLTRKAEDVLRSVGASVTAVCGPLEQGWVSRAPYDAIVVNGVVETVPAMLFEQLKEGGRLVAVVGHGPVGEGTVYRKVHGIVSGRPIFDAAAPILPNFATPPSFVF